jgi:imidazolonepropionase-like amidohydrolase
MKMAAVLGTLTLALAVLVASVEPSSLPATLAVTGVNVVDTNGGPIRSNITVVVRGDRIADIGSSGQVKLPADARIVDGRGKFLIPGLWDTHVHMAFGDWVPGGKEVALPLFVANGVTGVRDMGGDLDVLLRWRAEISRGSLVGPRIVLAGPMLDGPKMRFPSSVSITTPDDGRKAVDDLKAKGVDFIKVQSFIPRAAYFAVVDEARKQGLTLVGHVPDAIRASEASDSGQKSIEHLTGVFEGCSTAEDDFLKGPKSPRRFLETYNELRAADLIARFARNRTWQIPTLVWERGQWLIDDIDTSHDPLLKYAPSSWRTKTWPMFTESILKELDTDDVSVRRNFVQKELEIVGAMHRAGVPFMAGTDTAAGVDVLPGFSLHQELEYFVKAGFTPLEALQTATRNPAEFLGLQDQMGTVEVGKLANLVLLDANPLDDIKNTRAIRAVILNGRLLTRSDLDSLLAQAASFASSH